VIAIVVFVSLGALAFYQADTGRAPGLPLKWMGFAAITAVVFGYAIRENPNLWGKSRFWFALSGLFVGHLALGFLVLLNLEDLPLLLLAPLIALESGAVAVCVGLLFPDASD
jgi:hypothetical protein